MKSAFAIPSLASAILAIGLCGATGRAARQPGLPTAQAATAPAQSNVAPVATAGQPGQHPEPALTVRDQTAIEMFEPPLNEEYTLGAGDQISLDFSTQPDLDLKTTIGPDGIITVKNSGPIRVAGLTRAAAGKAIEQALSKFYNDASVTVSVDKYSANTVRVIGYVQHPGEISFEGTPTLLDAIGRAGMIVPQTSNNGAVSNSGPSVPEICTVYRGNDTALQVPLNDLLVKGSTLADMRLRRNDIVYVPKPNQPFVSVLGQVSRPGTIPLTPQSTLTSVLAEAGCCTDNGGFNPTIHILQPSTGKDFPVKYKELMTLSGQQEYTLHSGDVIVVPVSSFNKAAMIFQKVTPVGTIVSLAAVGGAF